jgi:hypothetical protein
MPTTTPNFGWSVPVSTDLVKDGATAIELLGDSIDASLVDLKGGTTGQVLTKASGTDMDFTFTTPTDQIPLTTKGDLLTFDTADARLGVGANGTVLTADSAETTGLKWATPAAPVTALTLIHTETVSNASSVNIDSKFTSTYTNYLVQANIEQSTGNSVIIQYRNGGSTIATGYKSTFYYTEWTSNTWNVTSSASDTKLFSVSYSTDRNFINMFIGDPQTSEFTKAQAISTDNTYNVGYVSVYPQTTSIDGLRFAASTGTMTGTIRIYGYQNS